MSDDRRSTSSKSAPTTSARSATTSPEDADGIPREAIAQRAFELFAASGYLHGRDVEHWLEAERQLRRDPKFR